MIYVVTHDGDGYEPTPPVWAGTDLELAKAEIRRLTEEKHAHWKSVFPGDPTAYVPSRHKIASEFTIHSFDDAGKFVDCQSGAVLFDPATEQGADHE